MAFDLLITRDLREPARPELGEVLVNQMGADAAVLATLLQDGRVHLRIGVDFSYASWCARALAAVGAVVELLPAGSPASVRAVPRPIGASPSTRIQTAVPTYQPGPAPSTRIQVPVDAAPPAPAPNPLGLPLTIESGDLGPFARQAAPEAFAYAAPAGSTPTPAPLYPPPQAAASPSHATPTPAPVAPADPFAPTPAPDMELALDVPAATPAAPRSFDVVARRPASGNYAAAQRTGRTGANVRAVPKRVVRTCERCGSLVAGDGECPRCAAGDVPLPEPAPTGLRDTLRARPPLRYGLGFALALGVGYLVQAPYAHRAELRVDDIRKEADALRYRFDPQIQERVRALDGRAKETAEGAFLHAAILWLAAAALVLGAWLWLT